MGMKLTKAMREAARQAQGRQRAKHPELYVPIAGTVIGFIPGEPPTVTHHDKQLVVRGGKPRMTDSKRLTAARELYLSRIPKNAGPPVAGPLLLVVTFFWTDPKATKPQWRTLKPDADNAAKVFQDLLCVRGWIENDAHVVALTAWKVNVPTSHPMEPGVELYMETLTAYAGERQPEPGIRFQPFPQGAP